MNLFLASVALGAILFVIAIGVQKVLDWLSKREDKQIKGK